MEGEGRAGRLGGAGKSQEWAGNVKSRKKEINK